MIHKQTIIIFFRRLTPPYYFQPLMSKYINLTGFSINLSQNIVSRNWKEKIPISTIQKKSH